MIDFIQTNIFFVFLCLLFSLIAYKCFLCFLIKRDQGIGVNSYKILAISLIAPTLLIVTKLEFFDKQAVSVIWGAFLGYVFTSQEKSEKKNNQLENKNQAKEKNEKEI